MTQNDTSKSKFSLNLQKIIPIIWILLFIIGLISFIIGLPYIFDAILLNPIAWTCYAIEAIPTIYFMIDILSDGNDTDDKGFSNKDILMMVLQIVIGIIYAILTMIFVINPTGILILDFMILFPMFLFIIIIAIIVGFIGFMFFNDV